MSFASSKMLFASWEQLARQDWLERTPPPGQHAMHWDCISGDRILGLRGLTSRFAILSILILPLAAQISVRPFNTIIPAAEPIGMKEF